MVIIILLVAIIAFFYLMGINLLFPIPETAYYYIFSSIVQSEAAIFGILFIIITFSLQYVSNKYQINTLKIIENSREIKSFTGIVIFSMITNLIALSLIKANWTLFSIIASLGIGSAFYFIISLYSIFKYIIKLSNLTNVTKVLISNTPKSEVEFFKWLAVLKDSVRPILESPDSVESKLLYIEEIFPTIGNKLLQDIKDNKRLSPYMRAEFVAMVFLAIVEPAIEMNAEGVLRFVVPQSFKYLEKFPERATQFFITNYLTLCTQYSFNKGINFILREYLLTTKKDNNLISSKFTANFLYSIREVISIHLKQIEDDISYTFRINPTFLQIYTDSLIEGLKNDDLSEQRELFLITSVKIFLMLAKFLLNLDKLVINTPKHQLANKSILGKIQSQANHFGTELVEISKNYPDLICNNEELLASIRKCFSSFMSYSGSRSYSSRMKVLVEDMLNICERKVS